MSAAAAAWLLAPLAIRVVYGSAFVGAAPALRGPTRNFPSREIQAIEPPPVPMVLMSSMGMRTGKRPTRPPLVIFGLAPSIKHKSVEVPPASSVTRSGKPAISAITAEPSAPAAGPDNAVVIGFRIT